MIIDTTLREGEQFFGAYFDMDTRLAVARGLMAAGIEEIELGCAGWEWLPELAARLRPAAGDRGTRLSVWCRLREDDLERAAELGPDRVNIGAPVSDRHLQKRLGMSRRDLFRRMEVVLGRTQSLGLDYVSVGLEDLSRADRGFALKAAEHARELGASRLRLSDTVGLLSPLETRTLVLAFGDALDLPLAVHCHNDFGMATANALTALSSGADFCDASLLGVGERAGIAALEELAAYMSTRRAGGYDLGEIARLARMVAGAADVDVPRNRPVIGRDVFSCESGLHVQAMLRDPGLFEPLDPCSVGATRVLAAGAKSGRGALDGILRRCGLTVPEGLRGEILRTARRTARKFGRPLSEHELRELGEEAN